MRRWTLAAAVTVLALAPASLAIANFTQAAKVTLSAHRAGKSTGIKSDVHSRDRAAPGHKPKAASALVITFPPNTKFNLRTPMVKACTLSDQQLRTTFGPSCPSRSLIGTGSAVANASPLAQTVTAAVKAYIGTPDRNIILVVKPRLPGAPTIVIHALVSGSKLTLRFPRLVLGRAPGFPGVSVVLVSLNLDVPALGSGSAALITAGSCKAHEFVVRAHFVYADHSTLDLLSSSRCT